MVHGGHIALSFSEFVSEMKSDTKAPRGICEGRSSDLMQHHYPDDEVKSAVWDYVLGYTTSVNNELRKGRKGVAKQVTDLLDRAFTKKIRLDVYRTVDWAFMENIFGITKDNIGDMGGRVITDKGYMSTASSFISPWGSSWLDDELVLHIVSDEPVSVIDVNSVLPAEDIDCEEQSEIILPRGSRIEIIGFKKLRGRKYGAGGTFFIEAKYAGTGK